MKLLLHIYQFSTPFVFHCPLPYLYQSDLFSCHFADLAKVPDKTDTSLHHDSHQPYQEGEETGIL